MFVIPDLKRISIVCLAFGFAILLVIAGAVILFKWRMSQQQQQPQTLVIQENEQKMLGPLPPIPEQESHYRSLIQQSQTIQRPTHPHTLQRAQGQQTMGRPHPSQGQARNEQESSADYTNDWRFGTAPWNKQATMQGQTSQA